MQIEIITVGNEILSGRILDTNFAFLARALEEVDVQVGWHAVVGDSADQVGEALTRALARADAVVVTGGLGPTPDDLTRRAVATLLGRPLRLDEKVLEAIRERAQRLGRKLPATIESQALIPSGAHLWPNRHGTAPGILIVHDDKPVVLLPGVPHELEALVTESLVPHFQQLSRRRVETFTLRTSGVFESLLHERIGSLPQGWPGAILAYLPSFFGVDLRVTVSGEDFEEVEQVTARAYEELRACVAPVIYAEGNRTMEEVVGEALLERGLRFATAESCTGGLLAKRVTDTPGSSRYFERGFVTYSNRSKFELLGVSESDLAKHGAVSAEVAGQMAVGAARCAGVEVAVGITGVAGPGGATPEKPVGTVFVAIVSPSGTGVRKLMLAGSRHTVRERATQAALDLVRRQLLALPLDARLG